MEFKMLPKSIVGGLLGAALSLIAHSTPDYQAKEQVISAPISEGIKDSLSGPPRSGNNDENSPDEVYRFDGRVFSSGRKNMLDYRIYLGHRFDNTNKILSAFHGINIYPDYKNKNIVNMIIEIPQGTEEKMEINKELPSNPIMYDLADGKIRKIIYQAKGSPYKGYPFHYGALPQTWEHKSHIDPRTKKYGDNDPIDVFDISTIPAAPGTIKQVKVLGAFAMIDKDETDWKLICIDINDEKADSYNDLSDVPTEIQNIIEDFLTNYKTPEGKGPNSFAEQKKYGSIQAVKIIENVHYLWYRLVNNNKKVIDDALDEHKEDIANISLLVEESF
jgi:inorganic pyrophosphatase